MGVLTPKPPLPTPLTLGLYIAEISDFYALVHVIVYYTVSYYG